MQGGHKLTHQHRRVAITKRNLFGLWTQKNINNDNRHHHKKGKQDCEKQILISEITLRVVL